MRLMNNFRLRHSVWKLLKSLPAIPLTVNTKHGRLSFSSHDRIIGEHLFLYKQVDYDMIASTVDLMRRYVTFDDKRYVIDIGANIGTVCVPLVAEGHFPQALAFEPSPTNVAFLKRNINQNNLSERVKIFPIGLSDRQSELQLEISGESEGDNRIRLGSDNAVPNLHREDKRKVIRVPVNTLDATLREAGLSPQAIQAIFMDVQGHEWYVLQGAQSVLATGVPLLMEVWPYGLRRANTDFAALTALLCRYYTHLVDLRTPRLELQPCTVLSEIINSLEADNFTDICLFRLGAEAGAG